MNNMKPIIKINADFLHDEGNINIIKALNHDGNMNALFVGGAVRDAIIGKKSIDIDIATILTPEETIKALKHFSIKYAPIGIKHGTISAIINNKLVEITTLRQDVATDGRHAEVQFTKDWQQDSLRRDFTLNALYCDIDGNIYDPTAQGYNDCIAKNICFVGDANLRIKEDYLRILRFFRFFAYYGGEINEIGIEACKANKNGIMGLSSERIWSELKKIFNAPMPFYAIKSMQYAGIFALLFNQEINIAALENLLKIEKSINPLMRLCVLLENNQVQIEKISNFLKLSNAEKSIIYAWARFPYALNPDLSIKALHEIIYYQSKPITLFNLLVEAAKSGQDFSNLITIAEGFTVPTFPITGKLLCEWGIPPSEKMGIILRGLEKKWVESDFLLDLDEMKNIAQNEL